MDIPAGRPACSGRGGSPSRADGGGVLPRAAEYEAWLVAAPWGGQIGFEKPNSQRAYWAIVNVSLAGAFVRRRRAAALVNNEAVPDFADALAGHETRGHFSGNAGANMTHGAKFELCDRLFTDPVWDFGRSDHAKPADAGMAHARERQQHEFEVDGGAVGRTAGEACHDAGALIVNASENLVDLLAAVLAPQSGEGFALDLAAEQRADTRAGEAEPQLVDEIGGEHEGVAERVTDRDRIDVAPRRRGPVATPLIPMREHRARRCMFHNATLFRRETGRR